MVGECADGTQAIDSVKRFSPDVVLMDIRMPEMDGIEATRRIVGGDGETSVKVLMLTTFDLDEYVYDALRAGPSGFLLKDVPADQLISGILMKLEVRDRVQAVVLAYESGVVAPGDAS